MDRILKKVMTRKGVVAVNLLWLAWFQIYLFAWTPQEGTWEIVLYGFSVVAFCLAVALGVISATFLITKPGFL